MLIEAEQWATLSRFVGGQDPHHLLDHLHAELSDAPGLAQAKDAGEKAADVRSRSLGHLTSHITTEGEGSRAIVVFNGLSWPRTDPVRARVAWPAPGPSAVAIVDEWDRRVAVLLTRNVHTSEGRRVLRGKGLDGPEWHCVRWTDCRVGG